MNESWTQPPWTVELKAYGIRGGGKVESLAKPLPACKQFFAAGAFLTIEGRPEDAASRTIMTQTSVFVVASDAQGTRQCKQDG